MNTRRALALGVAAAFAFGTVLSAALGETPAVANDEPPSAEPFADITDLEQLGEATGAEPVAFGVDSAGDTLLLADSTADPEAKERLTEAVTESDAPIAEQIDRVLFIEPAVSFASTRVVGGAGIIGYTPSNRFGSACSIGFPAYRGNGQPALLTAGHCALDGSLRNVRLALPSDTPAGGGGDPEPPWLSSGTGVLGQFGFNRFGGPDNSAGIEDDPASTDIAVIDITDPKFRLVTGVTDWSTARTEDLSRSLATRITAVGQPVSGAVSSSGSATGLLAGTTNARVCKGIEDELVECEILDGYLSIDGRWVHGFLSDLPGAVGDSGGAVFQGRTAVGLVSGGPDPATAPVNYTWATRLGDALPQVPGDYEVALHIGRPVVTSHTAGATVEPGELISGTVGRNAESVVIATRSAERSRPVTEGEWSFAAPKTPGTFTRTITGVNGHSTSAKTTVTFRVAGVPPQPSPAPEPEQTPGPTESSKPAPNEDILLPAPAMQRNDAAPLAATGAVEPPVLVGGWIAAAVLTAGGLGTLTVGALRRRRTREF